MRHDLGLKKYNGMPDTLLYENKILSYWEQREIIEIHQSFRDCRSQWSRGLRRGSAAARLLRLRVRIPSGAWMSVCCECFVLSGRGLYAELITRPEESFRLWCVVVRDLETSWIRRPWSTVGFCAKRKEKVSETDSVSILRFIISEPWSYFLI